MMKRENRIYRNWFYLLSLIIFSSSCIDETFTENTVEGTFITVRGITPRSSTHDGTPEDHVVQTLRILAFDISTENIVSNVSYNAVNGDIIRHPINPGPYNFVFLANEPANIPIQNKLNAIAKYSDLDEIAYPADFFASDRIIPMMQEIKNVTVLTNGQGATLDGGTTVSILQLALERLGVRVDVVLKAKDNLNGSFNGVVFSNIPDLVPLTAGYKGTIGRSVTRKFTVGDDGSYFADGTSSVDWTWEKKVNRIILPANEPTSTIDKDKAVIFTVDMVDEYSPSCELEIGANPVNYSLPKNSKLDLTGYIKEPLLVNVMASEWTDVDDDWNMAGIKVLNVSTLETSITDFNGARISFSSNMPIVKVLPNVYVGATGTGTAETETIFNDLVLKDGDTTDNGTTIKYATSRFMYTYDKASKSGSGYMDILLDEQNVMGAKTTYRLVLSVEDEDGGKLQREVKVNTSQYGERYIFDAYGTGYVGTFFRNDETGERIIAGQHQRIAGGSERPEDVGKLSPWRAIVEEGDFVVLSSTPSFDMNVGTDNPGKSEYYKVLPNDYKGESGTYVEGRGRIYFRIGLTEKYSGTAPRYAKVRVERYGGRYGSQDGEVWYYQEYIYVRQGEEADYIMRPGTTDPIDKGPLFGQARDYARKISPFNLTSPAYYLESSNAISTPVNVKQGKFVKYPTQAGAFFQWGLPRNATSSNFRLAYHPTLMTSSNNDVAGWITNLQFWPDSGLFPVWGTASSTPEAMYDYDFAGIFETCPEGYHRPSDGYIDRISYNGPYPNYKKGNDYVTVDTKGKVTVVTQDLTHINDIAFSELRQSLYQNPKSGDAGVNDNVGAGLAEPVVGVIREQNFWQDRSGQTNEAQEYITFSIGFYADGFFDRRPIKMSGGNYPYCVSSDNAQAAYRGILVYNASNNASVFFPSAGRRRNYNGGLEFAGNTGYFHSSSIFTSTVDEPQAVWSMFLSRWPNPGFMYQLPSFGQSIRCVKD